ncbi:hypothetical protein IHE45_12G000700 [Dioscorea alata]|uniref:Uncharacterized protein n=1 Tax=Dioscorea alata TaxID=55571 RepID=A0ACB7UZK7_DIOAL|nr:hypothetical protein IHE45_12G000700 [Dioscorea alata]
MANEMITAAVHPTAEDSDGDAYLFPHDDVDDDDALPAIGMSKLSLETLDGDGYLFQRDDEDGALPTIRMSRLSIETSDGEVADGELSDKDPSKQLLHDDDDDDEDDLSPLTFAGFGSLPGTPTRRRRGRRDKEYRSDGEARGRRREQRRGRDWWVEREWERRRRREQGIAVNEGECQLLVRRKGRPGCICMDIDEVKACRELGIELQPCDWTVGFSGSAVDTSSGGNSPIANWRISSPGDDPKDVKARLKMWAHAVALASSTSFSG